MNDYQRTLLADARLLIESEQEQFLCHAIDGAHCALAGQFDVDKNTAMCELRTEILWAIDEMYTFEDYLDVKHGIRRANEDYTESPTSTIEITYFERAKFDNIVRQCRLAWIDRMLYNNEVK